MDAKSKRNFLTTFGLLIPVLLTWLFAALEMWWPAIIGIWFGLGAMVLDFFLKSRAGFYSQAQSFIYYLVLIMATLALFSSIYSYYGIHDESAAASVKSEVVNDSNTTYYFSIVTFTTLGYGDFHPTIEARNFAAIQALMGYIFLSILVAKLIHLLTSISKDENYFKSTSTEKDAFMTVMIMFGLAIVALIITSMVNA